MMKKNIYRVSFDIKKGNNRTLAIDIEANNQTEAKQTAKNLWSQDNASHPFHIEAVKLKEDMTLDYNYFVKVK